MQRYSCCIACQVNHSGFAPWLCQVEVVALNNHGGGATCIARCIGNQFFGKCHYFGVVTKCLVALHHGELRVVARRNSFVAEHATNFKHAFHAANNESLQVQLQRNAQEQLHVQCVVVRKEWASVCAACFHVQHWSFHFNELVVVQRLAETGNGGVTNFESASCLFVNNQVGVSLAVTRVYVGKSVPFVGKWSYCLRQQLRVLHFDGQFTFARGHHQTSYANPVAKVEFVNFVKLGIANNRLRNKQLNVCSTVANGAENKFALVALQQNSAGNSDACFSFSACFKVAMLFANLTKGVCAIEAIWVWVHASCAHGVNAV